MRAVLISSLCLVLLLGNGCITAPPPVQRSTLEIREFQTRTFEDADPKMVMKALFNVLQDDGYVTRNAVPDLGLLTASKETNARSAGDQMLSSILMGRDARWSSMAVVEATANVTGDRKATRVRVTFQKKMIDNFGAPMTVQVIEDPSFYQDFFSKVDKSIFVQREGI